MPDDGSQFGDDAKPPSRKRGRRAGISRETVLQAAIALSESGALLSLNGVARSLNVTPMALYSYYASRDDLMQAVTAALLEGLVINAPDTALPVDKIRLWAQALREHMLRHPQLINLLAWENGHASVAWVNKTRLVFEALAGLGLSGAKLGEATLWIWRVIMGAIYAELVDRKSPARMSDAELGCLEPAVRDGVMQLRRVVDAPAHYDHFFDFQIARMIDGLERWAVAPTGNGASSIEF